MKKVFPYLLVATLALTLVATVGSQEASAKADYLSQVPAGMDKSCNLCHTSSIPALNQFGQDWVKAGKDFAAMKKEEPAKPAAEAPKAEAPKAAPAPAKESAAPAPAAKPAAPAYVQRDVDVAVGGKTQSVKAIIDKGRTLVPVRSLSELLGASVDWDSAKKAATVTSGGKVIIVYAGKSTAQVNGQDVKLDVSVRIINNLTYAPLRFIAENLGASVDYDSKTGDITISLAGGLALAPATAPAAAQPAAGGQVSPLGLNKSLALPGYVGSQTCGGCHPATYKNWQGTRHARMLQDAKDPNAWIIGDFSTNTYFKRADVLFSVGNGLEGSQRYVGLQDGKLMYLPAQWNVESHSWKPYNSSPYTCAGCHTAGYNNKSGYWAENGITCESCHGPGAEHARTADKTKIKVSTGLEMCTSCHGSGRQGEAMQKMWIPEGEENTGGHLNLFAKQMQDKATNPDSHYGERCLGCHSATFIVAKAKGEPTPKFDDFLNGPLKNDRNGITCAVCHDPHKAGNFEFQLRKDPVETCTQCHDAPDHHPSGTVQTKGGPIYQADGGKSYVGASKQATCQDCHMIEGSHTFTPAVLAITSHGTTTTYNACAKCHTQFGPASDSAGGKIDAALTAKIKEGQAEIKKVQAEVEEKFEPLLHRQQAVQKKFDDLKKADPNSAVVKKAEPYVTAAFKNVEIFENDGSQGIHNMKYVEAAFAELASQLTAAEDILK